MDKSLSSSTFQGNIAQGNARQHNGNVYADVVHNHYGVENADRTITPVSTVPFPRDSDHVHRTALFEQIRAKLSLPGTRVALVGLGGLGKTQLAIEYAYQVKEESPDTWVLWIHASSSTRFESSVRDLLDQLAIPGRQDEKADLLQLLRVWLRDTANGKWLLILDNVDDATFLLQPPSANKESQASERCIDYLPTPSHGSMLITSRSTYAASQIVDANCHVAVDPMLSDEAVQLAEKKLGREGDLEDIKTLVKELEYLPLAIAQAVAYVRQRSATWTIRRYLEKLRKNDKSKRSLLDRDEKDLRRDREARNSIRTWEISFEHIRKIRPSAADLLSLMSFFDRQAIPKEVLTQRTVTTASVSNNEDDSGPNDHSTGETDHLRDESDNEKEDSDHSVLDYAREELEEDLEMLRAYSFITITEELTMFEMHRLVQLATRTWLEANGQYDRWCLQFVQNLDGAFSDLWNREKLPERKLLYPHVISSLTVNLTNDDGMLKHASLMHNAAKYAQEFLSSYNVSEQMLLRSVRYTKRLLGEHHPATLDRMGDLAFAYGRNAHLPRVLDLYQEVIDAGTQKYGNGSEVVLSTMSKLAMTYMDRAQYDEAGRLEAQVLDMRRNLYPENDFEIIRSMLTLAETYLRRERYEEAEELLLNALQRMKVRYGEHHEETLRPKEILALLYQKMHRLDEAEKLQVEVLATRKEMFGEDHRYTIEARGSLASIYKEQRRYPDAERILVEVLAKSRQILGNNHVSTLASLEILAGMYAGLGRYKEAESSFLEILEERRWSLGEDHPNTFASMSNLANTYRTLGRYNEAEELQHEALARSQRTLGENHPDTLATMSDLADTYRDLGRYDEAEKLLKAVLERRQSVSEKGNYQTLVTLASLTTLIWCPDRYSGHDELLERYDEVLKLQTELLEKSQQVLGDDHSDTLYSMCYLATLLFEKDRKRAIDLMYECASISKRTLGDEHPHTKKCYEDIRYWESLEMGDRQNDASSALRNKEDTEYAQGRPRKHRVGSARRLPHINLRQSEMSIIRNQRFFPVTR